MGAFEEFALIQAGEKLANRIARDHRMGYGSLQVAGLGRGERRQ